jgi:hypothetical protein
MLNHGIPHNLSKPKKVWRKIKKTVIIDSRDRQITGAGSPGSYNVLLPAVYSNIYSIALRSYEIPLTYNNFGACLGNVTMNITYTPSGGAAVTSNITIPDGNYTTTTLPAVITASLSSTFSSALSLTWSSNSLKSTIASTNANDTIVLNLSASSSVNCGAGTNTPLSTGWGLGYYLGFYPQTYTSTAGTITSSFMMNPNPETCILLELAGLNKLDETGLDGRVAGRIDGAFAKIPLTQNSGEYLFFMDTSGVSPLNYRVYNPPVARLDRLTIRWRRHDGRTIDFNGAEHSFTLEFELLDNNFDEYSSLEFAQ